MQRRTVILGGLGLGFAALSPARAAAKTVVLELVTSQGCSSCPPADALLGALARRPSVIALAWHVDYWNGLGWRDPYASRQWTERQRAYADRLRAEVYTPALVVKGAAMVVGSNRAAVEDAIGTAYSLTAPVSLRRQPDGLQALFGPLPDGATALLAVYDPEAVMPVQRGENAGRRLVDYRIVREVRALDPDRQEVRLPPMPPQRGAVLLVQDAAMRVIGGVDAKPG